MDFINWGTIGFGNVIKNNYNGLPFNTKQSTLYGFTQRDKKLALNNQKKYNIPKFYNSIIDLLSDSKINAIYICTPPGLHFDIGKLCCDYKKPTYIEKPLCRNYQEVKSLVDYFKENNIPLWVAHYKRILPKFQKIKSLIESNTIGTITNITFSLERPYNENLLKHNWLYKPELSGGGRFFDTAPHVIDLLVYFFGNFELIHGFATSNSIHYRVEDTVSFIFKTSSNIIGCANFNFISNARKDLMTLYGTLGKISFSIDGGGKIELDLQNKTEIFEFSEPLIYEKNMVESINTEILTNTYNTQICHGSNAIETYRIIDLILNDFYKGRDREFWKDQ